MTSEEPRSPVALVVAVGNPDRGDDAAALLVAQVLQARAPAGIDVAIVASPTSLIDTWAGYPAVVVVDAVRSGRPTGTVVVHSVGEERLPARSGFGGSHAFGVADAIELARALGRLPRRLFVVGIEATAFAPGTPVSPDVENAIEPAADAVLAVTTPGHESRAATVDP